MNTIVIARYYFVIFRKQNSEFENFSNEIYQKSGSVPLNQFNFCISLLVTIPQGFFAYIVSNTH
jgi:hypothetical protein